MTQTAPRVADTQRTPQPAPDIDALLSALNAEGQRHLMGEPATGPLPDRQAGELAGRRVQALIRAFDVLHKQVAAIASQGETINSVADAQARQEQTLGELQRNMRYLRAIVIQQLQGAAPTQPSQPSLHVKLVVRHLAESYHQAQHDAGVLAQWAMLFTGVAVGTALGALMSALIQLAIVPLILATAAVVTVLVACIFAVLARRSRLRAEQARRAMDESTLVRPATAADGA